MSNLVVGNWLDRKSDEALLEDHAGLKGIIDDAPAFIEDMSKGIKAIEEEDMPIVLKLAVKAVVAAIGAAFHLFVAYAELHDSFLIPEIERRGLAQ